MSEFDNLPYFDDPEIHSALSAERMRLAGFEFNVQVDGNLQFWASLLTTSGSDEDIFMQGVCEEVGVVVAVVDAVADDEADGDGIGVSVALPPPDDVRIGAARTIDL